ncbi:MAG: plasmid replication initiation factor [Clostridiaceae bacterium]|nr:plasmid replication initiation factor [Syntrophus aciditrophicus]NLE25332.1 plasmid replication initiation factor [Clostridiaceae bacterium]
MKNTKSKKQKRKEVFKADLPNAETDAPACAGQAQAEASVIARGELDLEETKTSMAESVTRHAATPPVTEFQFLLRGIDTLDLGFYVNWGLDWKRRLLSLDKMKQQARKKGGLLVKLPTGRQCIFRANSKGENYRFHLQFEAYNLFVGKAAKPGSTPNVYLSISAKTLWQEGIDKALNWIGEDLESIGKGIISFVKVSRVDLCADFWIPGGLSYDFLRAHKVSRNKKRRLYLDEDEMESYYVASPNSHIKLRIYNKGLEVKKEGTKLWFLDFWKRESSDDIWRMEHEIHRPALKQFGINSLDDLENKQAGVWLYLTSKWFSLRLLDNEKAERRTIHPLWCAVQESFQQNAPVEEVTRICRSTETASLKWLLSHMDGCLSSFAARLGITDREEALTELQNRLAGRNNIKEFEVACIKKAIQLGTLSAGGEQ